MMTLVFSRLVKPQGVEGVRAVDVDRFRRADEDWKLGPVIQKFRARPAGIDKKTGKLCPAELVITEPRRIKLVERID